MNQSSATYIAVKASYDTFVLWMLFQQVVLSGINGNQQLRGSTLALATRHVFKALFEAS